MHVQNMQALCHSPQHAIASQNVPISFNYHLFLETVIHISSIYSIPSNG